jgi:hypothetical protein
MGIAGATYEPIHDEQRLNRQLDKVRELMEYADLNDRWMTLSEIEVILGPGFPQASVSARLRQLRSMGHDVQRRRRGNPKLGIHEYRVARREPMQERLF